MIREENIKVELLSLFALIVCAIGVLACILVKVLQRDIDSLVPEGFWCQIMSLELWNVYIILNPYAH